MLCYTVLELVSYIRFLWRAQRLVRHHTLLPPHLDIRKFAAFFISRLRREATICPSRVARFVSMGFWGVPCAHLSKPELEQWSLFFVSGREAHDVPQVSALDTEWPGS